MSKTIGPNMTHITYQTQPPPPTQSPVSNPTTLTAPVKYVATKGFAGNNPGRLRSNVVVNHQGEDIRVYGYFDELQPLQKGQNIVATLSRNQKSWSFNAKATADLYRNQRPPETRQSVQAPIPNPQRQSNAQSFEAVLNAEVDLIATTIERVAAKLPAATEETHQKLATSIFIDIRKTQGDDALIRWAAQNARTDIGF